MGKDDIYTIKNSEGNAVVLGSEHWNCDIHGVIPEVVRFSLDTKDEYVVCLWCLRDYLKAQGFPNITETRHIK